MDRFSKWLAVVSLLAACAAAATVGALQRFVPREYSYDMDTQTADRLLATLHRLEAPPPPPPPLAPYLKRNELEEAPYYGDSSVLPPVVDFRKSLKSSDEGMYVMRKEDLKEDWCMTKPLVHKIREPGCLAATVLNSFCYGQCKSFYIPREPRRQRDQQDERPPPAFRACAFCRPAEETWTYVTLTCPDQTPRYRRIKMQVIRQCKCHGVGGN